MNREGRTVNVKDWGRLGAKCLRNVPCQCTAHATTSVDIGRFKSESFPHTRTFSLNNTKFR